MKRQIPLHVPQALLVTCSQKLALSKATPPTEEQLTRKSWMEDDFYHDRIHVGMDTKGLVCATMHAFSSTDVPEVAYIGAGSFHRVFSLQFPDGFKVAARIPKRSYTQEAHGHIEATVAMMTMARCYTGIPVPEVYAWHPDHKNAVGAPYMLLEWIDGVEPWRQWPELGKEGRTELLDELAAYHARFAKPLPFKGIGSIYFAEASAEAAVSFESITAYRLGPLSRGPIVTLHRGISTWPPIIPTSLRDFWLEAWQHEVEAIKRAFGPHREAVIATQGHPSFSFLEDVTLGRFLDVSQDLLALITACQLPSQPELYEPCFAPTDYAFRNIKMDPKTRSITVFLDWDDVYIMPFLLCSRYPEDICYVDGSGEQWYKTGAFRFLPLDEEGEIEEKVMPEVEGVEEDESVPGSISDEDSADRMSDAEERNLEASDGQRSQDLDDDDFPEHDTEEEDRALRIQDTRLRRQYEQLLVGRDSRFGIDGFWESREQPLKIQHLLMHGWIEWLATEDWLKQVASELKDNTSSAFRSLQVPQSTSLSFSSSRPTNVQ